MIAKDCSFSTLICMLISLWLLLTFRMDEERLPDVGQTRDRISGVFNAVNVVNVVNVIEVVYVYMSDNHSITDSMVRNYSITVD